MATLIKMPVLKNDKYIGDAELDAMPAIGATIFVNKRKYRIVSILIKQGEKKSRKYLEVN